MLVDSSRRMFIATCLSIAVVTACGRDGAPAPSATKPSQTSPAITADMVVRGGKIVTLDDNAPQVEAIAIKGDTILATGATADISRYIGDTTRVIELEGMLAIPGFIEGHGHFMGIGDSKLQLDLRQAKTWDEIVAMVGAAAQASPPGTWIRGRGWHQEKWTEVPSTVVQGVPVHASLSAASPNHPVVLVHASGHASFVNAKALELAGIGRDTRNPPGGEIVRGRDGSPTGLLRETAAGLVHRVMEREENEQLDRKRIELATAECVANGITSFQDAGASFETIDLYKKLADEGALKLRLWAMLREPNEELAAKLAQYRIIGAGNKHLTVRGIKKAIDGALGSHGAWLLAPYADLPSSTGLNTTTIEDLAETAELAKRNGFQLCVHAIGDRGNRETLDVFERVLGTDAKKLDHRWRIEHAQHLHPDDIGRFATLGVIASMQGVHCTSDGPWVTPRLGETRAEEGAYVWRKLMDSGAVVTNGTDAPVEHVSPIASYYATVSRKMADGRPFFPDQRLTREEALRTYTLNPAHAAFEDDIKGSLAPGKLADITVLDQDILTVDEARILDTRVVYTVVGGKVVYQRPSD